MYKILPYPKKFSADYDRYYDFREINVVFNKTDDKIRSEIKDIINIKLGLLPVKKINFTRGPATGINTATIEISQNLDDFTGEASNEDRELFLLQGYVIKTDSGKINIYSGSYRGFLNALSTLKQLIITDKESIEACRIYNAEILDYPVIEKRALATTFAWYAGYGRVGFDMQLWGFDEWKEFINYCSDYKITQLNMCMYGYWPFEFNEFPKTTLKDFPMKIWNNESRNWIEIKYTHPNISEEFFSRLVRYAHLLGIDIHAYIGLNSYNGGYSNIFKDKRMKLPSGSRFINDFDTLCLSDESTIDYLEKSVKKIVNLGVDGIIFEESEESFWFCNCDRCSKTYIKTTESAAEAKHKANYHLLKILHKAIKEENPSCEVGLRAWREPPLEKSIDYLKKAEAEIPGDVCLYWAPGLYVGEEEFARWVSVFGRERICARDTEANAISACNGRLYRIFRSNILRDGDETNNQHIDQDIRQHKGSAALKVKGINGYMFEFYAFFLHLLAHANYGWSSSPDESTFYDYAISSVFGEALKEDVLYVLKNILTIHESQISIFTSEFPFMRNKVSEKDIPRIEKAKADWQNIKDKIEKINKEICSIPGLKNYSKHFQKIENAHRRNREIYELCLNSIKFDKARTEEEKIKYLKEMQKYNERDFDIAREMFFDIGVIEASGIRDSMFPYHEIKRVINNMLYPENKDERQIYLGVEALGWLWL